MIIKYIQSALDWGKETIGPWMTELIEKYPYIPLIAIALVWLIVALIQIRKRRPKIKIKKTPKQDPVPEGGYKNFKGEVWFPDGRRWNEDKRKWETSDYTEPPAPAVK